MTYSISPSTYRLGYSISWNVINSSLFFSRSVRLNIMLNTFLKGMLKYFRIKLVKWVSHSEGNYYKLVLVVLDTSYPEFYKIRFKSKRLKFFAWNYLYYNKATWKVVQLRDFYTVKEYKFKARLGSGKFWHKFYKSLFFSLGKKFLHLRKLVKNGNIDFEFNNNSNRDENSQILKLNIFAAFNKTKFGWDPKYQFMFKFFFKLHLYLSKWLTINSSSLTQKSIKRNFFIKLLLFNFFLNKLITTSKNEKLRKFYSRFINVNKAYYRSSKRIVPDINFYFDYFNYIKGANYRWLGSGRISQTPKRTKMTTAWSTSFLKGFLFNKSYKKIARRGVLGAFEDDKTTERIRLANFMIKHFVVWKKPVVSNLFLRKKDLFYNPMAINRITRYLRAMFIKKSWKRSKKRYVKSVFKRKYKKRLKVIKCNMRQKKINKRKISKSLFDKLVFRIMLSNRYYFNTKEDAYINKVGFFKNQKSKIFKKTKLQFLKRIKMNIFSRSLVKFSRTNRINHINRIRLLLKRNSRKYKFLLKKTKRIFFRFGRNKVKITNDRCKITESISFFRNKKELFAKHNPFLSLQDNFLLILYNLNFFSLVNKRKKVKIKMKDYSNLKSNLKLQYKNNILLKFYSILLYKNSLLTFNLFLHKYYYLLRVQRAILIFRFYWSLEFYKLYANFKLSRWNLEKVFKKSLNNFLVKKKFKSSKNFYSKKLLRPASKQFSITSFKKKNDLHYFKLKLLHSSTSMWVSRRFVTNAVDFCFLSSSRKPDNFSKENCRKFFFLKKKASWKSFMFSELMYKLVKAFFFFLKPKQRSIKVSPINGGENPLFFKNKYLKKEFKNYSFKSLSKSAKKFKWRQLSFFLMSNLFNALSKKKNKNSFQCYKFNVFFLKSATAIIGNKFGKSISSINVSLSKNLLLNRKLEKAFFDNICGKIRLSAKRLSFSKFVKKKKISLEHPKNVFIEFSSVKKELKNLFLKYGYLRYHRKFRHAWRNLRNYARSVTFFRNSLSLENWFLYLYSYHISFFFYKVSLQIRNLTVNSSSKYPLTPARLYVYKLLMKLANKKTLIDPLISKQKVKILLKILHAMRTTDNFAVRKSNFSFFHSHRHLQPFANPMTKAIWKLVDFRKVTINIVDKAANFKKYVPPVPKKGKNWRKNLRKKRNRAIRRRTLGARGIVGSFGKSGRSSKPGVSRKYGRYGSYGSFGRLDRPPIRFYLPPEEEEQPDIADVKPKDGKEVIKLKKAMFSKHFFNIFNTPNRKNFLKIKYFSFNCRLKSTAWKSRFYRYWINRMYDQEASFSFFSEKNSFEFENKLLDSFTRYWADTKYDHHSRHRKYFSRAYLASFSPYVRSVIRRNHDFLRAFPRRFVPSMDIAHSSKIFLESVRRYTKNLKISLAEIKKTVKLRSQEDLKRRKYYKKKNFPLKSRNRWIGRQNFRKYSSANFKEIKFEKNRAKKNKVKLHQKKFVYSYYRLQRNFNKELIKAQPKLFAKNVFNPKIWFSRKQNLKKIKFVLLFKEISRIANRFNLYNKLKWLSYQKKILESFDSLNYKALSFNFILLNSFKKATSSPIWKIYKSLYSTKFYLYRFSAKRVYSKQRNSYRISMPFNNNFSTKERQYNHAYLNRVEFAYATNNRFFTKFRRNWVKTFFTKSENLKIFYLYNKKIYYNFCLSQNRDINFLKTFFLKKMKTTKLKINNFKPSLKMSSKIIKKKFILFYFLLKNYTLVKAHSSYFNYFINFLLSNLLSFSKRDRKWSEKSKLRSFGDLSIRVTNAAVGRLPFNFYAGWFKIFLLKAHKLLIFSTMKDVFSLKNRSALDYNITSSDSVFKKEPWKVLYFGKFFRFFDLPETSKFYFNLFKYNQLRLYEPFADLIEFMLHYLYNFFTKLKNLKKLLSIKIVFTKLKKLKLKSFVVARQNSFFNKKLLFYFFEEPTKPTFRYYYNLSFISSINKFSFRLRNIYYFNQSSYSTLYWIKNKKFIFWMEQNLEKTLKMNVKLSYINSVKAISKFYRSSTNFFLYTKRLKLYRLEGGWRQQTIYADVLWVILISVKYYSSSFLSNMISEQIVKRKKQWPFIKILKTTISDILPKSLINNPIRVDGIRISINGKVNGRDRAINYLVCKFYKDRQYTKVHPIFVKIDYSLSFANSKYGVFGIKVWLSRI